MRLKCLLKSLYRVVTKSINSHASVWNKPSRHLRISSIIKCIILPLFAKRGRGELGKETNRKTPGRLPMQSRDCGC